jgi:hypothetical protein
MGADAHNTKLQRAEHGLKIGDAADKACAQQPFSGAQPLWINRT